MNKILIIILTTVLFTGCTNSQNNVTSNVFDTHSFLSNQASSYESVKTGKVSTETSVKLLGASIVWEASKPLVKNFGRTLRNTFKKDESLEFNDDGINSETGTKYNKYGYDVYGYTKYGFNKKSIHKDTNKPYDKRGFDEFGNNIITKSNFDTEGFDIDGFNVDGQDKEGFDCFGFNNQGLNKDTNTKFDLDGYDKYGYNKDGYDIKGFSRNDYAEGKHKLMLNKKL